MCFLFGLSCFQLDACTAGFHLLIFLFIIVLHNVVILPLLHCILSIFIDNIFNLSYTGISLNNNDLTL